MKVICSEGTYHKDLTVGKSYDVIYKFGEYYTIRNDNNILKIYYSFNFEDTVETIEDCFPERIYYDGGSIYYNIPVGKYDVKSCSIHSGGYDLFFHIEYRDKIYPILWKYFLFLD